MQQPRKQQPSGNETDRTAPVSFAKILSDPAVKQRFEKVRKYFFLRESTYDMTSRCNIRCEGCYYYEGEKQLSPENGDPAAWRALMREEKARGITYVVLAGAEPALVPELLRSLLRGDALGAIATNGVKRIPPEIGYRIHISVWGNDETSRRIRGGPRTCWSARSDNYREDPRAVFVYTFTRTTSTRPAEVMETLAQDRLPGRPSTCSPPRWATTAPCATIRRSLAGRGR